MNYIVPKGETVISCGQFARQQELPGTSKVLYTFKSKENAESPIPQKMIPDKIGFAIGHFTYVAEIGQAQGAAVFLKSSKHQLFEGKNYYSIQVQNVVEYLEKMLKIGHPCNVKLGSST
jgi:hypothetical protein